MTQTPKSSSSDRAQTEEASQVLAQYLELFSCHSHQFQFYLNANSVVDWFGRSVRGPAKIHDYLSKEVSSQYEHIEFEKAESCGPIEYKPTHMKTKIASTMEVDYIHPRNRVTGITSLKTYADSDMEDDDDVGKNVEMMRLSSAAADNKTPEKQILSNTVIEDLTPPASTLKPQGGDKDDDEVVSATESEGDYKNNDDADAMMSSRAKRLKRTHPTTPFSYLRRLPTGRKLVKSDSEDEDSSSSDAEFLNKIKIKKNLAYMPPLRYLEATGVLRRRRAAATTPASASSSWDREVRVRISYRRRVQDADQRVEFALVVYEHLSATKTPTRRNLCAEFNQTLAADDDDIEDDDDAIDEQEQPALVLNEEQTGVSVATVAAANTAEIAAALETAAFTIVPLRTPTKTLQTPPATPKRKPRLPASGLKRFNMSPSTSGTAGAATTTPPTPKRHAARSLRL